MGEVEHIPRSSDSMGVYALPVPRMRSPHRTQEQLRAESAAIAAPNPYVPPVLTGGDVASAEEGDRVIDHLLAFGAKRIAIKRLITGHAEMNTQLTFELRDKKLDGTISRRDLIRACRSLDLGWNREQLAMIADHFQLAGSKRCTYAGLVGALHQNDPRREAKRRAQAAAQAAKKAATATATVAVVVQQRAEAQRQLEERAPLSVPTSGPLTQPLASPVLVGGNWRLSPKRPDLCQIGYERSRPGRRAYIETTRDTINSNSIPPWDNSMAAGSGSVRQGVTTHGDRHFPVRQLLTPRDELTAVTKSKVDGAELRMPRESLFSELSSVDFMTTTSRDGGASGRSDLSSTNGGARIGNDIAYVPTAAERPVKVDMGVQAELEDPPELQPEAELQPPSDNSAQTVAVVAVASSPLDSSDLVEWQPGSRELMWEMSELDQEVALQLLGVKLFHKLHPPKQGRKNPRAPYAKVSYAHRMWTTRRAQKSTRRSRQSLGAERLRPETPEELSRFRKEQETPVTVDSALHDRVHLSPRTGAYVDMDSPLSPHAQPERTSRQTKREQSQLSTTSQELRESSSNQSVSWNSSQSESSLPKHCGGGLNKTWSTPALVSSKHLVDSGRPQPWKRPARSTHSPKKKEWGWEWPAARCCWQLMEGPDGNPPALSIDLYADDEHGFDHKIGAVSISMNEIIAGCAGGEPMWFRIFSTTRGTRTHKWQGLGEYRPEEEQDTWNLPELKTTTHVAIGAIKVEFSALGWHMFPQRQKVFQTVSSVQLAKEREEKRLQQENIAEDDADEAGSTSGSDIADC